MAEITELFRNLTFNFLSFAITCISLIAAIFFYFRGKKYRKPCWDMVTSNLISDFSSNFIGLQVLYKNKAVKYFSVSKIIFWNSGKETINWHDVATADPLRVIALNNTEILDNKITSSNNIANKFTIELSKDHKVGYIKFDYIDKNQGCVLQIVHTGNTSNDLFLAGSIKGVENLQRRKRSVPPSFIPLKLRENFYVKNHKRIEIIFILMRSIMITLFYFAFLFMAAKLSNQPTANNWSTLIVAGILFCLFIFAVTIMTRVSRVPDGLEDFDLS